MPCEKERNVSLRAKACWKGREKGSKKRKEREGRGKERKRKRRKNGGLVKRRKDVNKGNFIRNFFFSSAGVTDRREETDITIMANEDKDF